MKKNCKTTTFAASLMMGMSLMATYPVNVNAAKRNFQNWVFSKRTRASEPCRVLCLMPQVANPLSV